MHIDNHNRAKYAPDIYHALNSYNDSFYSKTNADIDYEPGNDFRKMGL